MSAAAGSSHRQESGIVLHHLESSRSQRILWLLEELGVPYTLKVYKRTAEGKPPRELGELHPLGKAPVLTDGDVMLSESGFIVEYLISKYGKEKFGVQEGTQAWRDNLFYTHYSEGSVQPLIIRRYSNTKYVEHVPQFMRPIAKVLFTRLDDGFIAPDLEKHTRFIENHLETVQSQGGWIAGTGEDRPTAADFMMIFTLETLLKVAPDIDAPRIKAYVRKVESRPAFLKALEKGGNYAYLQKTEPAEEVPERPKGYASIYM